MRSFALLLAMFCGLCMFTVGCKPVVSAAGLQRLCTVHYQTSPKTRTPPMASISAMTNKTACRIWEHIQGIKFLDCGLGGSCKKWTTLQLRLQLETHCETCTQLFLALCFVSRVYTWTQGQLILWKLCLSEKLKFSVVLDHVVHIAENVT